MKFLTPLASHDHHASQASHAGSDADDTDTGLADAGRVGVVPFPDVGAATTAAPAATLTGMQDRFYLRQTGDTAGVAYTDLHQDGLGDCYLLSSIGEVAMKSPSFIHNMTTINQNGTETVRLYEAANG